ncbi:MAG: tyrosine-protein phosphatase [Candidatus Edwardsbacteria bacterium]|nr:tyrosine-protein phosphatase [Candidatus Edwardsbacteria bacterium]
MNGPRWNAAALLAALLFLVPGAALPQAKPAPAAKPTAAADTSAPVPRAILRPCDTCLPGVVNFAKVSPALWRGAQPTAEGFRNLENAGIRTVVNLRHDHDDLPLLAGTKLKYLWLPCRTWDPDDQNIVIFLRVLRDSANWPVYVHCAQGRDRTGYCVASYRIVDQGWPADSAIAEMKNFKWNRVWFRNPGFLRKLDAADVRRRVQLAP